MGAVQSLGTTNSEFVDSLVDGSSIETPEVEFAFRLVDREKFFPPSGKSEAYQDSAWRGNAPGEPPIHISAPGIYTNVLENFNLKKGMSFLNIGSGSGYLSTIVGFSLGSLGVNHGVELNEAIVGYANEVKEQFLKEPVVSGFDWCIPEYHHGNAFNIKTEMRYDRIYCGARVPPGERLRFLKLLKIDGVCIMPYETSFQRIRRASEKTFVCREISSVEFGDMVQPTAQDVEETQLPLVTFPRSLFDITRASIRQHVRDFVGKRKTIYVNQKSSLSETGGYPRDESEDLMLSQPPVGLDDLTDENIDHRVPPETDREGYVIHSLRRPRVHIQINAIIDNDDLFEVDSDSGPEAVDGEEAEEDSDGPRDDGIDMRDGVPAQGVEDEMINADEAAENEEADPQPHRPVGDPSMRRHLEAFAADEVDILFDQAGHLRERQRIRDRFQDLVRIRIGARRDNNAAEENPPQAGENQRRRRRGRFRLVRINHPPRRSLPPNPRPRQQPDDSSSSASSPSRPARKRRAESSDSEDKRIKIEEKFYEPPPIFQQRYVRAAVLKEDISERDRPEYDERLTKCLAEFDGEFRSIISSFLLPRLILCQLFFTNFERN